jgi:hypothetical protein
MVAWFGFAFNHAINSFLSLTGNPGRETMSVDVVSIEIGSRSFKGCHGTG